MSKLPLNLVVGSALQLTPSLAADAEPLPVTLIGYLESRSVLVSHPLAPDGQLLPLVAGDPVRIHFDWGDAHFAFESRVTAVCDGPFRYLHLEYPQSVQSGGGRRSPRIPVNDLTMMLVMEDAGRKLSVALADISLSGARLVAVSRLGEVGDRFSIEIPQQGREGSGRIVLPCEIRYVREENGRGSGRRVYHHGVEFTGLNPRALHFIEHYIGERVSEKLEASS
ncbi:flagellar brake protein [Thiohalobacter sp. IOR34]|uniref:flagellar brake protein n=1 Tax=Thiohalobacter sp. IOR34 TaxID=3057176 RepID=UPI0025B1F7BE|nr:flagellar brake protein [Thiohalobacter sp. IOR34]WJW75253.1 flagellar brake protein [Thiohalobacter sp. IOR34]